jgi:hypothetical protein
MNLINLMIAYYYTNRSYGFDRPSRMSFGSAKSGVFGIFVLYFLGLLLAFNCLSGYDVIEYSPRCFLAFMIPFLGVSYYFFRKYTITMEEAEIFIAENEHLMFKGRILFNLFLFLGYMTFVISGMLTN